MRRLVLLTTVLTVVLMGNAKVDYLAGDTLWEVCATLHGTGR
jgi:hypothetical protein